MSETLTSWLSQELARRNWSHRELARQTGLSQSLVSKTLSGERKLSINFLVKVGEVLNEPREKLFRLAGILPDLPASEDDTLQELIELARNLPPEKRKEVLRYLRFLSQSGPDEDK